MTLAYLDKMISKGYGRAVTVGAFSTGIVGGGAGTIVDLDQPELAIGISAGVVVRPLFAEIVVQGGLSTLDNDETEALLAVDSLGLWTGDGTFTSENPSNMNSAFDKGSMCRVGSAFTADMTTTPRNGGVAADPVLDIELASLVETSDLQGVAANMVYRQIRLVYNPAYPEWLTGPCSLLAYFGGTLATIGGFVRVRWVEAPIEIMEAYRDGKL